MTDPLREAAQAVVDAVTPYPSRERIGPVVQPVIGHSHPSIQALRAALAEPESPIAIIRVDANLTPDQVERIRALAAPAPALDAERLARALVAASRKPGWRVENAEFDARLIAAEYERLGGE